MGEVVLLGQKYIIRHNARKVSEKFDEFFTLFRLLGYSIERNEKHLNFFYNGMIIMRITPKGHHNVIKKLEFSLKNLQLENKIHLLFKKKRIVRSSGYTLSFVVNDMDELPKILQFIIEEV